MTIQNQLVTQQQATNFSVVTMDGADLANVKEELDGLGSVSLDVIKTPTAGGLFFEIPGDDPENPETTKEIEGVIVFHHPMFSYWASDYAGADSNKQPDCISCDGKTGTDTHTGELFNCSDCPRNQFGSKGTAKLCRNMHRLYILQSGEPLPIVLNVPPSSLKAFKEFLTKRVIMRGRKLSSIITKISLKKSKNAAGIAYSQEVFVKTGDLTPEQVQQIAPLGELCKQIAMRAPDIQTDSADVTELDADPRAKNFQSQQTAVQQGDPRTAELKDKPIEFADVDLLK